MRPMHFRTPFFLRNAMHTGPMDDLERLRALIGPEAHAWTTAQLHQLQADIETMAALLLDLYRSGRRVVNENSCGSPNVDVPQPDR